ncbi:mCG147236 [Mus musculus]|nr:mCG147236 [Mus musculus]
MSSPDWPYCLFSSGLCVAPQTSCVPHVHHLHSPRVLALQQSLSPGAGTVLPLLPLSCSALLHQCPTSVVKCSIPAAPGQHPHGLLPLQTALEINHDNSPYAYGKPRLLQACSA